MGTHNCKHIGVSAQNGIHFHCLCIIVNLLIPARHVAFSSFSYLCPVVITVHLAPKHPSKENLRFAYTGLVCFLLSVNKLSNVVCRIFKKHPISQVIFTYT